MMASTWNLCLFCFILTMDQKRNTSFHGKLWRSFDETNIFGWSTTRAQKTVTFSRRKLLYIWETVSGRCTFFSCILLYANFSVNENESSSVSGNSRLLEWYFIITNTCLYWNGLIIYTNKTATAQKKSYSRPPNTLDASKLFQKRQTVSWGPLLHSSWTDLCLPLGAIKWFGGGWFRAQKSLVSSSIVVLIKSLPATYFNENRVVELHILQD